MFSLKRVSNNWAVRRSMHSNYVIVICEAKLQKYRSKLQMSGTLYVWSTTQGL